MDEPDGARAARGGRPHGGARPPQPAGARAHARSLARSEGILAANGALVVTTGERTGPLAGRPLHRRRAGGRRRRLGRRQPAVLAGVLRPAAPARERATCAGARSTSSTASSARSPPTACPSASSPAPRGTRSSRTRCSCAPSRSTSRTSSPASPSSTAASCRCDERAGGRERPRPTPTTRPATRPRRSSSASPSSRRLVLILGTMYGGEMKKALFTVMNYLLPERGVLPMHCSATAGRAGRRRPLLRPLRHRQDDALRRSRSPPHRRRRARLERPRRLQLRGRLLRQGHPPLRPRRAADLPGHPLRLRPRERHRRPVTRAIDWDDDSITENTRATYPVTTSPGAVETGEGGMPRNVFFLACDAFGVLPPISRLTPEMASYHFLSGFTAKVAGTEAGVDEPEPTFSACFGAPFMPRDPVVYADMLARAPARPGRRAAGSSTPAGRAARTAGQAHAHLADAQPAQGRARRRRSTTCRIDAASGVRRARAGALPQGAAARCSTRGRPGRTRTSTTPGRRRWRSYSPPTSSASPAACRRTSPRPARACSRALA